MNVSRILKIALLPAGIIGRASSIGFEFVQVLLLANCFIGTSTFGPRSSGEHLPEKRLRAVEFRKKSFLRENGSMQLDSFGVRKMFISLQQSFPFVLAQRRSVCR